MKTSAKKAMQLPSRAAMQALDRGQRTILDYSKVTPITNQPPPVSTIQNLARIGKR